MLDPCGTSVTFGSLQGFEHNTMKHIAAILFLIIAGTSDAQELIGQDFYANGKLRSTHFSDGSVERFITYFESGRVKEMGQFVEGRRDGTWKCFSENGALIAQAGFVHGVRQGTWEFRDQHNAVTGRLRYNEGRLAKGEQYDPKGELIAQRDY